MKGKYIIRKYKKIFLFLLLCFYVFWFHRSVVQQQHHQHLSILRIFDFIFCLKICKLCLNRKYVREHHSKEKYDRKMTWKYSGVLEYWRKRNKMFGCYFFRGEKEFSKLLKEKKKVLKQTTKISLYILGCERNKLRW